MTGVGAVLNTAKVEPGAKVAVFGAGGVGLNVIQGAVLAGAGAIIAVDLLDTKLALAREFGATHTVNASAGDPEGQIRSLTDGRGVDYAFEVIGSPKVITQAFASLARGGKAVVVGVPPFGSEVTLPAFPFSMEEKSLIGSFYGSPRFHYDMPRIIDLYMAGRLKLDQLVTKTFRLADINRALEALEQGTVARGVIAY
jgi:S-(hydroxymethyl)glutathione dehydrogenase/alcohol dehydrogenase